MILNFIAFVLQLCTAAGLLLVMDMQGQISVSFGFIVLSVITGAGFKAKYDFFSGLIDTGRKRLIFFLMLLYTDFSIVGNRAVVYPIGNILSVKDIIVLLLGFIWSFQLLLTAFYYFYRLSLLVRKKGNICIKQPVLFIVIISLIVMLPLAVSLIAFNPGISDSDSSYSIYFANHLRYCIDWFPPFYYMYLRGILTFVDSIYAVVIAQWLFFDLVVLEYAFLARKAGMSDICIFLVTALVSLNPANFLNLNSIWKDAPYVCSILWLTAALIKVHFKIDRGEKVGKEPYVEIALALVCTWFFRKNGIIPVLLTVPVILFFYRKEKKVYITCICAFLVILFIQTVVYDALNVRDYREDVEKQGDAFVGLGQDILGVYYAGGELSEASLDIVRQLTKEPDEYDYLPTYYKDWKSDMDIEIGRFIMCYIDTFFHNPVKLADAVFCRNDGIWAIYHGDFGDVVVIGYHGQADGESVGGMNYIYDKDGNRVEDKWNDYAPAHKDVFLTGIVSALTDITANIELIKIIIWRSGLHVWVLLVSAVFTVLKKRNLIPVYIPLLGHILSLVLACGWAVYRYYWPINLLCVVLFFMNVLKSTELKTDDQF